MTYSQKRLLLLLLGFLLLAMLVLAISLPGMQLNRPTVFTILQEGDRGDGGILPGGDNFIVVFLAILKGFMAIAVVLFPFYLYLSLQTKKGRRRLLGEFMVFAILVFLLTMLKTDRLTDLLTKTSESLQGFNPSLDNLQPPGEQVSFTPPASLDYYAQGLIWVGAILLAVIVGLVAWFLARPRYKVPQAVETRGQIAAEAQQAVKDIEAGRDFKDTILRCYAQMSQAIADGRGLKRGEAMTPAEFAAELKGQGLPEVAVEELTHLFEAVRYGRQQPGARAEAQAVACLNVIIEAVQ
jgi:hypothetical protein